jgi:hypothetical protein
MAKKKTEMVVAKSTDLLPEGTEFETLVENLSEMDDIGFPRIRFNNGKFKFTDDADEEGLDEFEGVLIFYGRQNTYWEGNYDPNNVVPPECFSVDGVTGSQPRNADGCFGECKTCAYNKFGSKGKGKACRNQMKLYIQVLGTTVPNTLFLAPTSLGGFTQSYIMNKIVQRGLSYFKVITKFKAYKKGNDNFFRIGFEVSNVFKGEEADKVKEIRDYWLDPIKSDRTRLDSSVMGDGDSGETNQRTVEPRKPVSVASNSDSIGDDDDDDDPPF